MAVVKVTLDGGGQLITSSIPPRSAYDWSSWGQLE